VSRIEKLWAKQGWPAAQSAQAAALNLWLKQTKLSANITTGARHGHKTQSYGLPLVPGRHSM
jgi:hypothetical protein